MKPKIKTEEEKIKKQYIKPGEFYDEICKSLERGELTDRSWEMIMKLCTNIAKKMVYQNPDDKEDCMYTAYEKILKYWKNFKPYYVALDGSTKKGNAFAYFTQIIKNGLAEGWNKLHPIKGSDKLSLSGNMYNL